MEVLEKIKKNEKKAPITLIEKANIKNIDIGLKNKFEQFIKSCRQCQNEEDKELLWKAFDFANKTYKGLKKNLDEYYIDHSISVAKIVMYDIGLGIKSVIAAILHDIIDETDIQIENIRNIFGNKIASILLGLSKIRKIVDNQSIVKAESFRKILLTLTDDIRVIFIKIADRLHHIRTIDNYSKRKQIKTITEAINVYVPLAHRLGLYNIKTELEDLTLKYTNPEIYESISNKIALTEKKRIQFITKFSFPITKALSMQKIEFDIDGRTKSVFSIWEKMQKKDVSFEEVYDLFAIRIVFKHSTKENEKNECWKIYETVTEIYDKAYPGRIRDWVNKPKANGYEALHLTVMSKQNRWVEVQIRSKRMDDIAEKGYASHWKYKGVNDKTSELDIWINEIRDKLKGGNVGNSDFFDSFNINLFSSEILVFTPKGKIITLVKNATVLDFAFEINKDLAYSCIGAKIGHTVVPINYKLNSGDIVEILTSKKQKPVKKWLSYVVSLKAENVLNEIFYYEKKQQIKRGKQIFKSLIVKNRILIDSKILKKIIKQYKLTSKKDFYFKISNGLIEKKSLVSKLKEKSTNKLVKYWKVQFSNADLLAAFKNKNPDVNVGELKEKSIVEFGVCCKPSPGDNIVGFTSERENFEIHKSNCRKIDELTKNTNNKPIKVNWITQEIVSKLHRIEVTGKDIVGIANKITSIIAVELDVNIKTLHFDTLNNKFYGLIEIYVINNEIIDDLNSKLLLINGIDSVKQIKD